MKATSEVFVLVNAYGRALEQAAPIGIWARGRNSVPRVYQTAAAALEARAALEQLHGWSLFVRRCQDWTRLMGENGFYVTQPVC